MSDAAIFCRSNDIVGEGPFWSEKDQALYWVDIVGKTLNCLPLGSADVKRWTFPELVCGAVPRSNGEVLVALRHAVGSFDIKAEQFTPFFEIESDIPGNRNNEMKCDPEGRLWIGTMQDNVNDDGSGRDITASLGNLFCVYPDLSIQKRREGLGISNTLAWSPDNSTFYFADSMADTIWSHAYDAASGTISGQRVLLSDMSEGAPDGSAIDEEGWLWNARFGAGCVLRISPDGTEVRRFDVPVTNPTSCAFGGPDLSTLYVTSARFALTDEQLANNDKEGAVVALQTNTRGLPTTAFAG